MFSSFLALKSSFFLIFDIRISQSVAFTFAFDHKKIFCIDLTTCNILSEKNNPSDLLTIIQKILRTALKIWNNQPFSSSERVNKSLSIVFPFALHDRRRVVIARSDLVPRLNKRGIKFPLLAYKYNAEEPTSREDNINTDVLKKAGETYLEIMPNLISKAKEHKFEDNQEINHTLCQISSDNLIGRDDFIYWSYEQQYSKLTNSQKRVVDYKDISSPLRIEGAAGTGKTLSLIMRAYKILNDCKKKNKPIKIAFFSHSNSTHKRNLELFSIYENSNKFLDGNAIQSIQFITLLDYCCNFSNISPTLLTDRDALDAKNYELMIIESILTNSENIKKIRTYFPLLSDKMKALFADVINEKNDNIPVICQMLHHEFGVQIKGRTDCTIDKYLDIPSIKNGLPCSGKKDKELVFTFFNIYQDTLREYGSYDVNDVTLETLSRLNGPIWRRERVTQGFDYIFVDEMHLFNVNEQSTFHYLTKSSAKEIPMCFALDYNQAIGDYGDKHNDYIEASLINVEKQEYNTVFRNSPQIADFCASIAASGTLMFQTDFNNPYSKARSNFTSNEENMCTPPTLIMVNNDDDMINELSDQIDNVNKSLKCKPNEIAIISFDSNLLNNEGIERLNKITGKKFALINSRTKEKASYILASPYDINGLEFSAVILLGVDEGRVPQLVKTSDISQHFIKYSAYNLLYLTASRAKYQLILLGAKTRGVSSCLEHSISTKYLLLRN